MEIKNISVLIVDDHPLITEAYITAFNYYSKQFSSIVFSIATAVDCDSGLEMIKTFHANKESLDIVILDIKLPPSEDGKILSGEDLGLKINRLMPDVKTIVSTTFNDNYRVHSIFKSLNPDGFLIKNDITPKELIEAIHVMLNDPPYYSKTVIKLLRNQVANDLLLDNIDRRLLYELSIGTRMKDLPIVLPLSLAGIEKRKRNLKHVFNIDSLDDRELLRLAKEKGFI